jgi:hypothetical protein
MCKSNIKFIKVMLVILLIAMSPMANVNSVYAKDNENMPKVVMVQPNKVEPNENTFVVNPGGEQGNGVPLPPTCSIRKHIRFNYPNSNVFAELNLISTDTNNLDYELVEFRSGINNKVGLRGIIKAVTFNKDENGRPQVVMQGINLSGDNPDDYAPRGAFYLRTTEPTMYNAFASVVNVKSNNGATKYLENVPDYMKYFYKEEALKYSNIIFNEE